LNRIISIASRVFILLTLTFFIVACEEEDGTSVGSYLQHSLYKMQQWKVVSRQFDGYSFKTVALGPEGSLISSVRDTGVFISSNQGANWVAFSDGLPAETTFKEMVTGSTNAAFGIQDTVCYMKVPGSPWNRAMNGIPLNTVFFSLEVNLSGRVYSATTNGLYYFETGAGRWIGILDGIPGSTGIRDIGFSPGGEAVALTETGDLYRSMDGISNWRSVYIPYYIDSTYAIALTDDGVLNSLLRSRRVVLLYNEFDDEPVQQVFAEDVRYYNGIGYLLQAQEKKRDPYINDIRHYQIMRSIDGGRNWVPFYPGLSGFLVDFTFDNSGNGYAVTADGSVFRTIAPVQ